MIGKWTDEQLEQMRQQTDPLADQVVAELVKTHDVKFFNALMRDLVNNRDRLPESLPGIVREFFEQTEVLPNWADHKKIKAGEKVFILHGPEMVPMLLFTSLPNAYSMAKGAPVLAITAQLTGHVHRRIFRTAQFVADVMQPGGLGHKGRGIRSVQKVRLIHASIRYSIKNHPQWQAKWNPDCGEPVNQEDLASTLLDFSVRVMQGVQKMGIRLTAEEAEAYHHCWQIVGHILGIRPELQAETVAEAYELAGMISARQAGKSVAGTELAQDLIQFLQSPMPGVLRGLPATAIRYFSGDKTADLIESGPYDWTLLLLRSQMFVLRGLNNFRRRHPRLQKYIRFLTWSLMHKIVLHEEGKAFYFELPPELRDAWQLPVRSQPSNRP